MDFPIASLAGERSVLGWAGRYGNQAADFLLGVRGQSGQNGRQSGAKAFVVRTQRC